jgi:hypothetical protein
MCRELQLRYGCARKVNQGYVLVKTNPLCTGIINTCKQSIPTDLLTQGAGKKCTDYLQTDSDLKRCKVKREDEKRQARWEWWFIDEWRHKMEEERRKKREEEIKFQRDDGDTGCESMKTKRDSSTAHQQRLGMIYTG